MNWRSAATLTLGGILVIGLVFSLVTGVEAKPKPGFLPAFESTYPDAVGSRIDSCTLCHNIQGSEYKLNPYAKQWKEDQDFIAINSLDADGDGYTNLEEIQARTFPGNASDNPSTVTTTTTIPGVTTTTAAPGSGGAIFQSNCASCHGSGGGNLVPTSLSLPQIVSVVSSGRGGMPGFSGTLTSVEIQLVSEYLIDWTGTTSTTTTTTPGTAPDGKSLFGASCAGCHGASGGDLVGTTLSLDQLVGTITSGTTTGMPSFNSTYSAAQIDAIAGYILSLAPPATTTTTTTPGSPPPPPPSGATVFSGNCAGCHGASGGNLVGRNIATSRISAVVNGGTPGMPGFATKLSTAEVDAVVAYVAGKTAAGSTTTTAAASGSTVSNGAALFSSNCAGCHGSSGGNLAGHSLSDTDLASVVANGRGSMPAFGSELDTRQIDAVVSFLSSLGSGPATAVAGDGGAASLYVKYCSACHGAHGEGGVYDAIAGTTLERSDLIGVITTGRGLMPDYSERMTADEIDAVAGLVLAFAPADGAVTIDDGPAGAPDPAPIKDALPPVPETDAGGGSPATALALLGFLGLAGGLGYVRWRASRGVAT